MAAPILYLAFDGVLHPNNVRFQEGCWPCLCKDGHTLFENNVHLKQVIESCPYTRVVLHTWWVLFVGYWAAVRALPPVVQSRVIGATSPGNRYVRFRHKPICTQCELLEHDLERRRPENPVLLDCDYKHVPTALTDSACILDGRTGLMSPEVCQVLVALLAANGGESQPTFRLSQRSGLPPRRVA